jgi:RND family efflux transporter MFP subunit
LDAKRAEFELAKTGFERAKQLYKKKLISTDTYDQSETQYKAAQASLKQAQADLKYTKIIAPFDGVISMTFVKEHQVVAASQPVLNIINNQELDVVFTVPVSYVEENGLENIEFSPLTVTMDSRPELHVPAVFKEISTQPDPDTNSYTATVTMERPQTMNLLPGMAAQVHASHSRQSTGLSIADSAWLARTDQTGELFLFDQVTETISRVDVLFDSNGRLVSGLSAGDLIIEAGVDRLVEGQRVKAWTKEGGI